MPRLPAVPGATRDPRRPAARTGAGPGDGPGPGRTGPGRPQVGGADGAVQPARQRGRLRVDGNPDVRGRARAGALIRADVSVRAIANGPWPGVPGRRAAAAPGGVHRPSPAAPTRSGGNRDGRPGAIVPALGLLALAVPAALIPVLAR